MFGNVVMEGFCTVGDASVLRPDRYAIDGISRVGGGLWRFTARVQYDSKDGEVAPQRACSDFLRAMSTWGSLRFFLNRRQTSDLRCDFATGADQIGHKPVVHVEDPFVIGPIPHVVTLRQHSPDLRP